MAQQLRLLQSLWAMDGGAPTTEWPLQTQLEMIATRLRWRRRPLIDPAFACESYFLPARARHDLAGTVPSDDVDDLIPVLELVARHGADHVNLRSTVIPLARPHPEERA